MPCKVAALTTSDKPRWKMTPKKLESGTVGYGLKGEYGPSIHKGSYLLGQDILKFFGLMIYKA